MEKFFSKAVGHCTKSEMFSPPRKEPKPCLYVSFGLNWKVLLTKEFDWFPPGFTGNRLTTARPMLSVRIKRVTKRRILAMPKCFINCGHPLEKIPTNEYLILLLTKISVGY